jgi:two-component system NarL family sensor kinase
MRQRAAILGAAIDFISIEGGGLMVCVKVLPTAMERRDP